MKFVFPLTKEDGNEFKDQNELETLLQHEKIGQFGFNPNNSSWHGGIHFTDQNAPWLKSARPVRAIADGKVFACRVGKEYQTSEFMGEELQFSNDFCLIQHSVANPQNRDDTFTFYSLYMHLAPLCSPHREVSANARYELTKNRNIRLEAGLSANEVVLRASSVIEATNDAAVTADGYIFKTFTVINNQNNTDTIAAEGNTVWLATHKEKQPVDISDSFLTDSSYTTYDTENSDFDMSVIPCVQTTQRWRARASSDMSKVAHTLAVESKLLRLENIEPVRSDKYLMAAYEIIDSKGERSTNVDLSTGSTIWLAVSEYPEPTELFSAFTKTYAIPSWLYTEVEGRVKVDKLSGRSDPTSKNGELNAGEKICTLTKGTRVKYSKVKDSSTQFIGSTERHMARCSFPDNDVKDDNGQSISAAWVCIEDNLVEVIRPKTVELSSDGVHKVNSFGGRSKLTVKAGDPIGYLGRFDAAQLGQNKPYKSRYQVHFEVFSTEQPPQFFIDMFFGQTSNTEPASADATQPNNDDTVQFKIVEDSFESDGFLDQDEPSEFFQLLFKKLTLGAEDVPGSDIIENLTDWDSCKYAIIRHASEWASKSGDKPFLDKLTEKYSNNDFKQLIEHEKSRIDNLIWMPNTQTLSKTKQVWNWWPLNTSTKNSFTFTLEMLQLIYPEVKESKKRQLQGIVDELNAHIEFYQLDTPLRRTHFFAQIMQETGTDLQVAEYTNYRITTLDEGPFPTARGRYYPQDHPKHAGQRYIDVHGIHEKKNGVFVKKDGTRPTLDDKRILFNVMYGGRPLLGNGDYLITNDGWNYRGRGLKQLTGRDNYTEFNKWHKTNQSQWPSDLIDTINHPELLLDIKYATRSAAWFWVSKSMAAITDKYGATDKSVNRATKIINENTDSYQARRNNFKYLWEKQVFR